MQTSFLAQLCLFCVLLVCVYEATGQMTFTDQVNTLIPNLKSELKFNSEARI